MKGIMDLKKGSLLYISMLFVMAGSTALNEKDYVGGSLLLLLGAGIVFFREYFKIKK